VQVAVTVRGNQRRNLLASFVEIFAVFHDLSAERSHAGILLGIVPVRHYQHGLGTKQVSSISDGEAVVPTGSGDHSPLLSGW
jgi:hypothetical protein